MKVIISLLLFCLSINLFAQNKVGISEVLMSTANGDQPSFEFFIPDTDSKEVLNAWNNFHKNFKVKPKQDKIQKNYYFTDNAFIPELSENTIDIYARIYETGNGVRFTCAFDLGGVFISSDKTPAKFTKTTLLLNKFYAQMAMDAIVAEIESELAQLEIIKKEYESIDKEINDFAKQEVEITQTLKTEEDQKETIENALNDKSGELVAKQSELKVKKEELVQINKTALIAELTGYETNLKKTDLESVRIEKDIARKEAEIATVQADINILKNDLVAKNDYKQELTKKVEDIVNRLEALGLEKKEEKVKLLEQNIADILKLQTDLDLKKGNSEKVLEQQKAKIEKIKQALVISQETKKILEQKIIDQNKKIKSLEELKATIE